MVHHDRNSHVGGRVEVALIGAGIGRSLSPALHEREGRLLGFDYRYHLYDLLDLGREPEDIGTLVAHGPEREEARCEPQSQPSH